MESRVTLKMGDLMSEDDFFRFCQMNDPFQFERDQYGNIIVMSPTGSYTGSFNSRILVEFGIWNVKNGYPGELFDSSTGFTLPNGAVRSPDVSWVRSERWNALSQSEKERFAPVCPDFVIEIRSRSDDMKYLMDKMQEYQANGCQLGWLIDRFKEKVYLFRPEQPVGQLDSLQVILSDEVLFPGLSLDLGKIISRP